jgi:hypothetical protein
MRIGEWMAEYEKQLFLAVKKHPDQYPWAFGSIQDNDDILRRAVENISNRMKEAFQRGSYNKDGYAIKWTCKAFGIKHTYTAINNFIAGK